MPTEHICSECGAVIPSDSKQGLCTRCLFTLGLKANESGADAPEAAQSASELPLPVGGEGRGEGASNERPRGPAPIAARIRYFGDYELLAELGRGGMGVVYKARQISLRRLVALKMISAGELASPTSVQRFHVEAEAVAKLDHPNIVPIYEIGVHQGQHYFTMKLVEGGSLPERVPRGRGRSGESVKGIRQAVTLLAKIARAIHYAHRHGVLHRDLKPGNILLDAQGEPHITDFGLAKILEHEIGVTRTGELMGTPSYMSPEQAAGRQLSTAADIWSFGVILYELLTSRLPFSADNMPALLRKIVEEEPAPPIAEKVDRDLETICLKCLEKDPPRRYASAAALADDLEHWLRDEPVLTRRAGVFERITKWARRQPALATAASVALVLFLVVVVGSPLAMLRIASQRERAKQEAAHAQAAVLRLEIERAESVFAMQSSARGVAYLARLVRQYPTNAVLAERLVNSLSGNSYCLPSAPPLKHADKVTCGQFSPDGGLVVTTSRDGTARIWTSSNGAEIGNPLRHSAAIRWVEFSPDGQYVVTASDDGSAMVWDIKTRQPISPPLRHHDQVLYAAFSPEGERVVTASRDRTVQSWYWKKGLKASPTIKTTAEAYFATFSPSGHDLLVAIDDATARIFSCTNGDELASYPHRRQAESAVPFPQYSPNGDRVVTLQSDGAQIWKVAHRDSAPVHLPHGRNVTSAVFSRDGRQIATASTDHTTHVWDARTGASVSRTNQRDDCLAVQFSNDGKSLLTGTADNLLMVLSPRSGEPQAQPLRHESRVTQVRLSSDGHHALAVTDGNHALLWGIRRVKVAPREFTHKSQVHHAVFSPDGHRVATASRDRTARVWDIATGRPITPPLQQNGWINVVRFSPDGQRIATVSENQEVQVWDASTGEQLMKPVPESTATQILDLQYSSDGRTIGLATGGRGGGCGIL